MWYNEPDDSIFYIDEMLWKLDVPYYELTPYQLTLLQCVDKLQEEHLSIRNAAKEFGLAKSTLHEFIHGDLGHICYELESLVLRQLKENQRRSLFPRKQDYLSFYQK